MADVAAPAWIAYALYVAPISTIRVTSRPNE
jgi:hypothetical protein